VPTDNTEDNPEREPVLPGEDTGAEPEPPDTGKPEGLSLDQASLDALLAADAAQQESTDSQPQGDELPSDEELEARIAEKMNSAAAADGPPGLEGALGLDEEALNSLLDDDTVLGPHADEKTEDRTEAAEDVESVLAAREPLEPGDPQEVADASLDQAAVDALMSVASTDTDGQPADAVPGEAPDMLQPPGLEKPMADGDLEDPIVPGEDKTLAGEDQDNELSGAPGEVESEAEVADAAPSADMINELMAAASSAETESSPGEEGPAPQDTAEDVTAVVSRAIKRHREQKAAASPDESEAEGESPAQQPRWRPPRSFLKLVTTLAVGAVSALGAFTYLYVNQERIPDAADLNPLETTELGAATRDAEQLAAAGEYEQAIEKLERALPASGRGAAMAERADAQFLLAKASYGRLGEEFAPEDITSALDYVNAFLDIHPRDARAVNCLRWKAALLSMQDAPVTAAALYAELMKRAAGHPEMGDILLEAARTAVAARRHDDGIAYLERLLREYPAKPAARDAKLLLADAYARAGRWDDAAELLKSLAQSQPDTRRGAEAAARLAQLEIDRGRTDEAIELLQQRAASATTVEGNDRVYLALAKAYRAAGRTGEARTTLKDILDFFPESDITPAVYVELSKVYEDLGHSGQAMLTARQAVQRYAQNRDVLNHIAGMLERREAFADAAEYRLQAFEAGIPEPELLLTAARDFRTAGDYGGAIRLYRRLVGEHPRSGQALEASIELAESLLEQGRPTEALERLENLALATPAGPRQLPVLLALGKACEQLGLKEHAVEVYKKIAASSVEPPVLGRAAVNLMSNEEWDEGIRLARRLDARKLDPALGAALLTKLGEGLLMKNPEESAHVLAQAYEGFPEHRSAEMESLLIRARLSSGDIDGAGSVVEALQQLSAGGPEIAARLASAAMLCGRAAFEHGDFARAADLYAKVAELPEPVPEAQWAKFRQASALMRLGQYRQSATLFDEVAGSDAPFAEDAKMQAAAARAKQRVRPVPPNPDLQAEFEHVQDAATEEG